jgi:hypothetical protein
MITFDLVQALNNVGTDGKAVFGAFSVGTFTQAGFRHDTFQVFDDYEYNYGPAYVPGQPFDQGIELGWRLAGVQYPHVAIENINGNHQIVSSLWNESMYFHPGGYGNYTDSTAIPCVVRFTAPSSGSLSSIVGVFKRGLDDNNGKVGWVILKNGVPLSSRISVNSGQDVPINTSTAISAGDVIDFVVDLGDDNTTLSDDSSLTLVLTLELEKTQSPVPSVTGNVQCTDTSIPGTIPLTQSGTVTLRTVGGGTILGTSTITPITNTANGQWTISGLNLSNYGGDDLELVAIDPPSTLSEPTTFTVDNTGCIPVVTADAVNDTATTTVNTPIVINLSTNDTLCN